MTSSVHREVWRIVSSVSSFDSFPGSASIPCSICGVRYGALAGKRWDIAFSVLALLAVTILSYNPTSTKWSSAAGGELGSMANGS